jgi:hypothetical protein
LTGGGFPVLISGVIRKRSHWLFVLPLLVACGDSGSGPAPEPQPCNGSPVLCDRAFDEVAYVTTHNAYANAADGFAGPNQENDVPTQLERGARALMLDVYDLGGEVVQYHGIQALGVRPLRETLLELKDFLDANPREVVSLIFESYVPGEMLAAEFDAVGLTEMAHSQVPGEAWPTLGAMIEGGARLVVFTDSGGGARSWLHPVWNHAFETHYSFAEPEDFDCAPNRGDPAHPLFILNHFLTQTLGSAALAEQVNYNPLLEERVARCASENDAFPNFITVDFENIGDVYDVVAQWNQ